MTTAERVLQAIIDGILQAREWVAGWLGPALPLLQSIAIIVSAVFLWGIIYSILGSGYLNIRRERYMDMFGGNVGKRRQLRAWGKILKRVRSNDLTSWKQAILEADQLLDDILKMSGYRGDTVHERFQQVPQEAISNRDQILAAHKVRDRVRQEPDLAITRDETISVLKVYERVFKELGLIS